MQNRAAVLHGVHDLRIDEDFAHPVPDTLSDDAAAPLEPLSVGVWACRKGRVTAGSRVLVNGAGPIGLVAAQCALAFGVTDVTIPRTAVSTSARGSTRGLRRHMGSTRTCGSAPARSKRFLPSTDSASLDRLPLRPRHRPTTTRRRRLP